MVASHGNFPHLDVSASFTVAQFVWSSKVDSAYGVGTRCPQSPPPRRHRHVTCTSSATMQYSCLYFHAHGSVFVLAGRGGCLCKLYSAQETREDGGFHHKATVCLHTVKEDKKKKQCTKPHARFAAPLKRRWEDKVWREEPRASRYLCDKGSNHLLLKVERQKEE